MADQPAENAARPDEGALAQLGRDLTQIGFDQYLLDTAVVDSIAKDLAVYLRDEAGVPVPAAVVRLGLRLLARVVYDRLSKGSDRILAGVFRFAIRGFEKLPGCDRFCSAVRRWAESKAKDTAAKKRLDALLSGTADRIDDEFATSLSMDLRLQLHELGAISDLREDVLAAFAGLTERLDPQPQLDPKLLKLTASTRLQFGARKVPFVARDVELEQLRRFLYEACSFAWWLITGPGGIGKSRLALQVCHTAGPQWRTGFLPAAEIDRFDWARWRLESPTLLVVDNADQHSQSVGKMLDAFRLRRNNLPLDQPVRILLLARHRDDRWWHELLDAGDGDALVQVLYHSDPLCLSPLDPDGLWRIVETIGGETARRLGRDTVISRLQAVAEEGRPLFAALAGEALAAGAELQRWSHTNLLERWLHDELINHWQPGNVDLPHSNLAALATMTRGIAEDVLTSHLPGIDLPSAADIRPVVYEAIVGRHLFVTDGGTTIFPPLEPNILGTYFVLEHMRRPLEQSKLPSIAIKRAGQYHTAAWARGGSDVLGLKQFLDRAKDDFPEHPMLVPLLAPPADGAWQRQVWGMLAIDIIFAFGNAGSFERAEGYCHVLDELARRYPEEAELCLRFAEGNVNLVYTLVNANRLKEAEGYYRIVEKLFDAHPGLEGLHLRLATGAANLLGPLARAGRIEDARELLQTLETLDRRFPDEPNLRLMLAESMVKLIKTFKRGRQRRRLRRALAFATESCT